MPYFSNNFLQKKIMQKLNIENIVYDQGPNPQFENKDYVY